MANNDFASHIKRIRYQPDGKEWHLRFVGHIDDLIDFEPRVALTFAALNPVVYDRGREDELDLWLDWDAEFAGLLFDLDLSAVTIEVNERTAAADETT